MSAVEQELAALLERVAQLEQQVAANNARTTPAAPPEPYQAPPIVPRSTVPLGAIRGDDGLPRDYRELRQLAVAVALGRGDLMPGGEKVRADYVPLMVKLHGLRTRGLSWRAAMGEVPGLDAPSEGETAHEARAVRSQLRALWDGVLPVLGAFHKRLPGAGGRDLTETFRRLLL